MASQLITNKLHPSFVQSWTCTGISILFGHRRGVLSIAGDVQVGRIFGGGGGNDTKGESKDGDNVTSTTVTSRSDTKEVKSANYAQNVRLHSP